MAAPQVPQLLDNQRLARPEDLERIGIVIVSSFRSNPKFAWQRAYHEQFPVDTLAWYSGVVASYLRDPNFVVVVALDKYDPDERSKSIAIIPVEETELKKGDPVIVGACAWRFEEGSKRKGQFSVKSSGGDDPYSTSRPAPRDRHESHYQQLIVKFREARTKYYQNDAELDMLAVHPAYWGRKHGKELVKWGLELARIDGVKQGLTGSELGMGLYKSLGFELKTELVFEGDEDMPEGLRLWTLVFDPAAHKASSR